MKTSSYGKFLHNGVINTIVDDFTLYQMPPKAIDKLCENQSVAVAERLKKNRYNLVKKISNLVKNVILAFDFKDSPTKKGKKYQNVDELKKETKNIINSFSVSYFMFL